MNSDEKKQSRLVEEDKLLGEIEAIVNERKQWKEQADEYKKEAECLRVDARKLIKEAKEKERRRQEVKEKINPSQRILRRKKAADNFQTNVSYPTNGPLSSSLHPPIACIVEWALKEERRKSTEWPKCYGSSKIGRIILGGCGGNEKRDYQYLVGNSLDYDFSLTERNVLQLATKAGVGSLIWPSLRGDLSSEKLSAANIRRKFR